MTLTMALVWGAAFYMVFDGDWMMVAAGMMFGIAIASA